MHQAKLHGCVHNARAWRASIACTGFLTHMQVVGNPSTVEGLMAQVRRASAVTRAQGRHGTRSSDTRLGALRVVDGVVMGCESDSSSSGSWHQAASELRQRKVRAGCWLGWPWWCWWCQCCCAAFWRAVALYVLAHPRLVCPHVL